MNILFLDFDGVIVTPRHCISIGEKSYSAFDPTCMNFILRLIEDYDVKIVISSSWRHHHTQRSIKELLCCAGYRPIALAIHDDWQTSTDESISRTEQIHQWLSEHEETLNYVILDDDYIDDENWVRTDVYNGILVDHYFLARGMFGVEILK